MGVDGETVESRTAADTATEARAARRSGTLIGAAERAGEALRAAVVAGALGTLAHYYMHPGLRRAGSAGSRRAPAGKLKFD